MKTQKDKSADKRDIASITEARTAIEQLSKADFVKLLIIARYFKKIRIPRADIEPEDILQDAILRTLDGCRNWNKKVSIIKHLDRAMESESGHIAKKCASQKTISLSELPIDYKDNAPSPDDIIKSRDDLESVLRIFAEDTFASTVLQLKADGFKPSEIQQQLGIDSTKYASILRRIRRNLIKYAMKGDCKS